MLVLTGVWVDCSVGLLAAISVVSWVAHVGRQQLSVRGKMLDDLCSVTGCWWQGLGVAGSRWVCG